MRYILQITVWLMFGYFSAATYAQDKQRSMAKAVDNYLVLKTKGDDFWFVDKQGNVAIEPGKYTMSYTDTLRTYAIVLKPDVGFVGIDRNEQVLYDIFNFDNGPDYPSDGLFRIIRNGKIGYADLKTGAIRIQPIYEAAYPFDDGKAQVALKAHKVEDGEHYTWESDNWITINKLGEVIDE